MVVYFRKARVPQPAESVPAEPAIPPNALLAEDGVTPLLAEDGVTFLVAES